jgi:hypothetical protein
MNMNTSFIFTTNIIIFIYIILHLQSTQTNAYNLTHMALISPSQSTDCIQAHTLHLPASSHETCLSVRFTYGTAFADTHEQLHHSEVEDHKLREHENLRRFVDEIRCPKTGNTVDLKVRGELSKEVSRNNIMGR